MTAKVKERLITVETYHQMAEDHVLSEDDRVELIEGEIVEMAPIGRQHAACVDRLTRIFMSIPKEKVQVSVQNPIRLNNFSEPQPDISLLKPQLNFYEDRYRKPEDTLLLIEVAYSSTQFEKQIKIPLYARQCISEVWVVDLKEKMITTYTKPTADCFKEVRIYQKGQMLSPGAFPDFTIRVDEVLE